MTKLPSPEPSSGIESFNNERQLALSYSSKRKKNYELYLSSDKRTDDIAYLPIRLDIENVSRCNFRCTMCTVSDWKKGKRAEDMSLDNFKKIIDNEYGLVEIKLVGIGEPMMQGDDYYEMIKYARSQHIWVRTITNGSLLHIKDNYKKLVDSDPNEIQISIDGSTKEVYEGIRRGSVFDMVKKNCKLINNYCNSKNIKKTKMWTVVQKENYHQLEELVDLASELGFSNMVFSLDLHGWSDDKWINTNSDKKVQENNDENERFQSLVERGAKLGVKVYFWFISDKYSFDDKSNLCPWPFERAVISSDMRTVPCCMIGNPDVFEIGNDIDVKFEDTWKSTDYINFRKAHIDGDIPKVCQGCYK